MRGYSPRGYGLDPEGRLVVPDRIGQPWPPGVVVHAAPLNVGRERRQGFVNLGARVPLAAVHEHVAAAWGWPESWIE